jgi:hypothetical protein
MQIEEDQLTGTDALSLRDQMIHLGYDEYLPHADDVVDHHRGWNVNVLISSLFP